MWITHTSTVDCKHRELGSLLNGLESERSENISDMRLTNVNEAAENERIPSVALNIASLSPSSTRLTNAGGGSDPVFSVRHNFCAFKL
jgi:hypothetical protein